MECTRWNYTKQEWNYFLKHRSFDQPLKRILARLVPLPVTAPVVIIKPGQVIIGERQTSFSNERARFRDAELRHENDMNLLTISFEDLASRKPMIKKITIPVPRGRLREAIALQENLTATGNS